MRLNRSSRKEGARLGQIRAVGRQAERVKDRNYARVASETGLFSTNKACQMASARSFLERDQYDRE